MLLLFSWKPVREMYPSYEVVMFQPWTGTPPDLDSIDNFHVAIILIPALQFSTHQLMST